MLKNIPHRCLGNADYILLQLDKLGAEIFLKKITEALLSRPMVLNGNELGLRSGRRSVIKEGRRGQSAKPFIWYQP